MFHQVLLLRWWAHDFWIHFYKDEIQTTDIELVEFADHTVMLD